MKKLLQTLVLTAILAASAQAAPCDLVPFVKKKKGQGVNLTFFARSSTLYTVQYSYNKKSWITYREVAGSNAKLVYYVPPIPTNRRTVYYRVIEHCN